MFDYVEWPSGEDGTRVGLQGYGHYHESYAKGTDGTWRFDVTVASADTGWDKYADAWEVRLPDGTVVGTRELLHPHVDEQPFTRSLSGVAVPADVDRVVVAARDSVSGFCGETIEASLGP